MYELGIRVPFIVAGPLVGEPGSTSHALVHVVDVLPTVADIAGVDLHDVPVGHRPHRPAPARRREPGAAVRRPHRPRDREVLYSERFGPSGPGPYTLDLRAVRDDRYKLILDAVNDIEQFFEYPIDGIDEGPDLLPCGLTAEQEEAHVRLRAAMDTLVAGLLFDAAPFTDGRHRPPQPTLTDMPHPATPGGGGGGEGLGAALIAVGRPSRSRAALPSVERALAVG